MDPNLIKYSPDVLKKNTKFLDIINTNKICFIKINVHRIKSSGDMDKDTFSWRKKTDPYHCL